MNFNFFDWIRDGVRRSVLLGVSDAVEQMGAPPEEAAVKDNLLEFFQGEAPSRSRQRITASPGNTASGSAGGTRKLGRGLKEVQAVAKSG